MSASLGIVVETLANDFERTGVEPTIPTEATVMILPAAYGHHHVGWYGFRLAAATYTSLGGLVSA